MKNNLKNKNPRKATPCYNLNASIGFKRAARLAGKNPAKKPIMPKISAATIATELEKTDVPTYSSNLNKGNMLVIPQEMKNPIAPPMKVIRRVSNTN